MQYQNAAFEMAAGRADQLPAPSVPEIVFSGKSNVGKSSLINKLLNRKALARVSSTPGKTATINFYTMPGCRFVDLPGYGYAKVSESEKLRWASLVEGYLAAGHPIACVIQLIDMRHAPSRDDLEMIQFLLDKELPFALAATKSDKLNKTQRAAQLQLFGEYFREIPDVPLIPFSAMNGEGVDALRQLIDGACAHR